MTIECSADRSPASHCERPPEHRARISVGFTAGGPRIHVYQGALHIGLLLTPDQANELGGELIAKAAKYAEKAVGA
jgi:hypothetical protein